MFDEQRDFKEYTDNIAHTEYLSSFYIFKNLSKDSVDDGKIQGLKRVMTILLRGYLFHNPDDLSLLPDFPEKYEERKPRMQKAVDALNTWCLADNGFPAYIKTFVESRGWALDEQKKNYDVLLKKWKETLTHLDFDPFTPKDSNQDAVWYLNAILADAIEQGPLKPKIYCYYPKEIIENLRKWNKWNKKKKTPEDIVYILSYMKLLSEGTSSKYVSFRLYDFGHVLGWSNANRNKDIRDAVFDTGIQDDTNQTHKKVLENDPDTANIWWTNYNLEVRFSSTPLTPEQIPDGYQELE